MNGESNGILKMEHLTKHYGKITAVNDLNLEIEKGEIFGLLGPNGAGKTTTILMTLGLTEPSSGKVWVAGHDATFEPLQIKSMVGYLPDRLGFYPNLTGWENLKYIASLNGQKENMAVEKIVEVLERVGLAKDANRKVGGYSHGMKQRLGIAEVLLKDPELVIMDEPTLGVDPEGVRMLLKLIESLAKEDGRTVLISSHLLHQMQEICDEVGIFVKGRLIARGTIQELSDQILKGNTLFLEVQAKPQDDEIKNILKDITGVKSIDLQGDLFLLTCTEDVRKKVVEQLAKNNYTLMHLHLRGYTLDDIYREYFQKEVV